jgi:hypothetical protein
MMAGVHRSSAEWADQNMTAGPVAFGAGAVLKDQQSKAPDAAAEGNGLTGS